MENVNRIGRILLYLIHCFLVFFHLLKLIFSYIKLYFVKGFFYLRKLLYFLKPVFLCIFYLKKMLVVTICFYYLTVFLFLLLFSKGYVYFTFLHASQGNLELLYLSILLIFLIFNELLITPYFLLSLCASLLCFFVIKIPFIYHKITFYLLLKHWLFIIIIN